MYSTYNEGKSVVTERFKKQDLQTYDRCIKKC